MKRLFNEREMYNPDGVKLYEEIYKAILPIFKKYIDKNYSMSDIELIAIREVTDTMCFERLKKSFGEAKKRMKEKILE